MLSRRRVETQSQYDRRTGRATKEVVVGLCFTDADPTIRLPKSSVSVVTVSSLESCDRRPEHFVNRRRRSRGRVQLYRQFEVDLSSRSQSESPERSISLYYDVCGTGDNVSTFKDVPPPRKGDSKNETARRSIHMVISEGEPEQSHLSSHSGGLERQKPGISPAEEEQLRKASLEFARKKRTEGSTTHLIDQIEVVQVNQMFRTNGAISYAEIERIGMVFAPTVSREPKSMPLTLPGLRGDDVSYRKTRCDALDHSVADTSTMTKKTSNHGEGRSNHSLEHIDEAIFRKRIRGKPRLRPRSPRGIAHWQSDPISSYRETIKSDSSDESERADEALDKYYYESSRVPHDRYDTHPARQTTKTIESRNDTSSGLMQVDEHHYGNTSYRPTESRDDIATRLVQADHYDGPHFRSEAHRFIDSNSNIYYLVKESPTYHALQPAWNHQIHSTRRDSYFGQPVDPVVGPTWQLPSSPYDHRSMRIVERSPPSFDKATSSFDYNRSMSNWQVIDAPLPFHLASNVGLPVSYIDIPFEPSTLLETRHLSDHRTSIQQGFSGPVRSRSKSPIRLYSDPPVPRHMDGSPIKKQSTPMRKQVLRAHDCTFGRDVISPNQPLRLSMYDTRPVQYPGFAGL